LLHSIITIIIAISIVAIIIKHIVIVVDLLISLDSKPQGCYYNS